MNDRELLELAAKAAGYAYTNLDVDTVFWVSDDEDFWTPWNPLTDDGDALRLLVKTRARAQVLPVSFGMARVELLAGGWRDFNESASDDPNAAMRRAIVRAAAEIGRTM